MSAPQRKIGRGTALLLLVIAAGFDLAQAIVMLIPFVGPILAMFLTAVAWICFGIWFGLLGASVVRTSPATYFGILAIELPPFINLIPGTVFMVAMSIRNANRS